MEAHRDLVPLIQYYLFDAFKYSGTQNAGQVNVLKIVLTGRGLALAQISLPATPTGPTGFYLPLILADHSARRIEKFLDSALGGLSDPRCN